MSEASTRYLTPQDAATYLGGLNSRSVTRWAREGYLPAYPLGEDMLAYPQQNALAPQYPNNDRQIWRALQRILGRLRHGGLAQQAGGELEVADVSPPTA